MDTSLVDKVLGDPTRYPDALKSWVQKVIAGNPLVTLEKFQVPGAPSIANLTLAGTWTNAGGSARKAGSYKDPFDRVFLCGKIGGGASGSTITTLPPGERPSAVEEFIVGTDTGAGRVSVDTNGIVKHVTGGTGFVSLAGISFRAA